MSLIAHSSPTVSGSVLHWQSPGTPSEHGKKSAHVEIASAVSGAVAYLWNLQILMQCQVLSRDFFFWMRDLIWDCHCRTAHFLPPLLGEPTVKTPILFISLIVQLGQRPKSRNYLRFLFGPRLCLSWKDCCFMNSRKRKEAAVTPGMEPDPELEASGQGTLEDALGVQDAHATSSF